MNYSDYGRSVYGNACEFDECNWNDATCDVHHINYQEQQAIEEKIREYKKDNKLEEKEKLIVVAKKRGFLDYDEKTNQLSKDDRASNLCVLCPNHHRYVHYVDMGKDVLTRIKERRRDIFH